MSFPVHHGASRRDNVCYSVRVAVGSITGIEAQDQQTFYVTVKFPREDEIYTSPKVKSNGILTFKYNTRFVPDDLLRNDMDLIFQEPLKIALFRVEQPKPRKIAIFRVDCKPLITKKSFSVSSTSYSFVLRKKLTASILCEWEVSFDRNKRRNANFQIFDASEFEKLQTMGADVTATFDMVRKKSSGEILVMKTLKNNDKLKSVTKGKLDKESNYLVTFNHPSLIHIAGFIPRRFVKQQQPAIIMDYIPIGSLLSILEQEVKPIGWNATKLSIIVYGIAFGLHMLHSAGLMHYELTTSSILLDEKLEPKLGDIGLTKLDLRDLQVVDLIYRAPEVLLGKPYDYSADVYSFGMILYRIWADKDPYAGLSAPELLNSVMIGNRPEIPFGTPENIKNMILACTSYDPKNRPEMTKLVKNRLAFIFPGTDRRQFEAYCNRMNERRKTFEAPPAMNRISISARLGIGPSQFIYGMLLKKETTDSELFKLAADQGVADAEYSYGVMLMEGIEVAKDPFTSAVYFKSAASKGHSKAALNLGLMYAEGKYVKQNERLAMKYFTQAAEQGNPKAQVNMGLMCMHGRGVRRNEMEAMRFYRMAAEQNDPQAQFNLAIMLSSPKNPKRDDQEASIFFKRAAWQGLPRAQFSMGIFLMEGRGIRKNLGEASHYFKLAADAGVANAQLNYGIMLNTGIGCAKDQVTANEYFLMAAQQNDAEAQALLGMNYLKGAGVKQDVVQAAKWLGDSAALGNTKAMVNIGMMFLKGKGVPKSIETAKKCFEMAAAKGNKNAQHNLHLMAKRRLV